MLPAMTVRGEGYIVNVSSEASLRASASGVAYSVSKYGINAITRHVAVMYRAQGIRCNAVSPGAVQTNVAGDFHSGLAARVLGPVMGSMVGTHIADPKQLADVICFLCDEHEASNVNGAIIPVDGGWSAL